MFLKMLTLGYAKEEKLPVFQSKMRLAVFFTMTTVQAADNRKHLHKCAKINNICPIFNNYNSFAENNYDHSVQSPRPSLKNKYGNGERRSREAMGGWAPPGKILESREARKTLFLSQLLM